MKFFADFAVRSSSYFAFGKLYSHVVHTFSVKNWIPFGTQPKILQKLKFLSNPNPLSENFPPALIKKYNRKNT